MIYTAALKGELHVIKKLTYSGVDFTGGVDPYGVSIYVCQYKTVYNLMILYIHKMRVAIIYIKFNHIWEF